MNYVLLSEVGSLTNLHVSTPRSYHIRIIPVSRPCDFHKLCLIIPIEAKDTRHTAEAILNVSVVPP